MNLKRLGSAAAVILVLVAFQDASLPTGQDPGSQLPLILDGRDAGENGDFFWLPPLEANPVNQAAFEADNFDPFLRSLLTVRICAPIAAEPCASADALAEFTKLTGPGGATIRLIDEHYQADWDTQLFDLTAIPAVRIFALVSDVKVGLADVEIFENGKQFKNASDDVIALKDGRTLPLNFRLELGIRCFIVGSGPDDCGAGVVDPDAGGTVSFGAPYGSVGGTTTAGVFVGPRAPRDGSHTDDVVFVVQSCLAATGFPNLVFDIPTYGPCIDVTAFDQDGNQITALPVDDVGVPQPITIFACLENADLAGFLTLKSGQDTLLRMHRQEDIGVVEALPLVKDPCALTPVLASSPSSGIVRFARAVLDRVVEFIGAKPLNARRRHINRRSGGVTSGFSQFQLALPSKMEIFDRDGQTADAGTRVTLPPSVLVTDAQGNPVNGASITFATIDGVIDPTGPVLSSGVDDQAGKAALTSWTLRQTPVGDNTLTASCFGCAVEGEGTDGPQMGIFDPFTPLPGALPDDPDLGPEVQLQTGELVFTAEGVPGPPATLEFTVQPTTTEVGVDISPAVEVTLEDRFDNLATNATAADAVSLTIGANPSDGTLSGGTAVTPVLGVSTFPSLKIDETGVGYTLLAGTAALSNATTSAAFDILAAPVVDQENDPEASTSFGCGDTLSLYQGFTPTQSSLARVQLRLRAGGSFPMAGVNTTIKIRSVSPNGSVLGTATTFIPGPLTASTQVLVDFDFDPPLTVTTGAIHVIEGVALDASDLSWMGISTNPYAGGTAFRCTGSAMSGTDLNFRTFSR